MSRTIALSACLLLSCGAAAAQSVSCDMQGYKPAGGLQANMQDGLLTFLWDGEHGQQLRTAFTVKGGLPQVQEMAVHKPGSQWMVLGTNLQPEFHITSGKRRMAIAMQTQFKLLGIEVTQELYDKEKWMTFWDAPLVVPGVPGKGDSYPLPRDPSEIQRADATFHSAGCKVLPKARTCLSASRDSRWVSSPENYSIRSTADPISYGRKR